MPFVEYCCVQAGGYTEQWDYVRVRPGAHLFYWLYHTTSPEGSLKTPLILWLQVSRNTFDQLSREEKSNIISRSDS